jgi:hypothetical protein
VKKNIRPRAILARSNAVQTRVFVTFKIPNQMSRYRVSQTFHRKKEKKVHQPGNERITTFSSSKAYHYRRSRQNFFFFFSYMAATLLK